MASVRNAPHLRVSSLRLNGKTRCGNTRIVLVASRFNESLTHALVDAASRTLVAQGIARANIRIVWVPGAFELPGAAAAIASTLQPDAIVALGCVVKGQTPQYAAIGQAAAVGLAQVSVSARIPVSFGVIIADSMAQATARAGLPAPRRRGTHRKAWQAGGRAGNRGTEAALAALAMLEVARRLPRAPSRRV